MTEVGGASVSDVVSSDPAEFLVRRLRDIREQEGRVSRQMMRFLADSAGVDERTAYRWVAAGTRRRRPRERTVLSEEVRCLYFELNGSVARVLRHCAEHEIVCPPRETLRRLINTDLSAAERAYAKHGEHARRANTVYLSREVSYRNAVWETDHKKLGVLVKPPRANAKPVDPWLTTFMDVRHRVIGGVAISLQPTAGDVIAAFRSAVLKDEGRRNALWGIPDEVRWDNGREFLSNAVTEVAQTIGSLSQALPSYSPHLKGRIERWHRTLDEEFLGTLPFWQDGPRRADGKLYGSQGAMLSYELLCERLLAWIDHYNFERPHSALGDLTPAQSWAQDDAAVRELPPERLRWMMLPSVRCKVGQAGIHHRGHKYVAPEVIALRGETVEVRYMPHDERQVDVYVEGAFVCTATVAGAMSAEDQQRFLAERKRQHRDAVRERKRASRRARVRLASVTQPGEEAAQTTVYDRDQAENEGGLDRDQGTSGEVTAPAGLNKKWTPPPRPATTSARETPVRDDDAQEGL